MKLYVAMISDRHAEPEPYVFSTPEAAISFAESQVRDYARSPEDIEVTPVKGWLFHATYSGEGDSAWVMEKTLDSQT